MNGKLEDKLALLAFGDLSPEEAVQLEREAASNPEARRALLLYKDMRDGLRGLANVPDDQFSKERLRDAILTQGLKPVPPRPVSSRSWLWMPFAACAICFGIVTARNSFEKPKPVELVMGTPKDSTSIFDKVGAKPMVAVNEHAKEPLPPVVSTVPLVRRTANTASRRGNRHRLEPGEVSPGISATATIFPTPGDWLDGDDSIPVAAAVHPDGPVIVPPPPVRKTEPSGPLYVIDQDKDAATGAQKATEVSSLNNELIGG